MATGNDSEQEWETESSGGSVGSYYDNASYDGDSVDDEYYDDEGFLSDEFGTEDIDQFLDDPYLEVNIEGLTPAMRANRRLNLEDDVMSEFSGDEKYEMQETLSGENGRGDNDMIDYNPHEQYFDVSTDGRFLTNKTRRLMQKLTKGRLERERKLKIKAETTNAPGGHHLHRLMIRGPDFPQEIEFSPAITCHFQCANSLTVTPSTMGLRDDLYTLNTGSIIRCGVLNRMTKARYHYRQLTAAMGKFDDDVQEVVVTPVTKDLKSIKASKFLEHSVYRYDDLPMAELYSGLEEDEGPLCLAHRYGYLAHGRDDGSLVVYCTDCADGPHEIYNDIFAKNATNLMLNSAQIVRWPRYDRPKSSGDGYPEDGDEDEQEGYSVQPGQFDHYVVMAGNEYGLFIAALPDHPAPKDHTKKSHDFFNRKHTFKFKKDHTWIRNGFQKHRQNNFESGQNECLNDAKASPNGHWIAVVGDTTSVWVVQVTHEPETEKQRVVREQREVLENSSAESTGSDSEYTTDSSDEDESVVFRTSGKRKASEHRRDQAKGAKSSGSPSRPRLLHKFGHPERLHIPEKIVYSKETRAKPRHSADARYSSQYLSWNASSTKFAHTSDTIARVYVWSMPSKEIICCVDTGAPSFAIDFHPVLDNLFAFANWYGFVHVVDISGTCVGDPDLIPEGEQGSSGSGGSSALSGCNGPTYEEKHDILMLSFRGEQDRSLRILDCIRGLGWSTDGRHLYVATLRRVLKYELADEQVRIPSLFQLCANKVRDWKERTLNLGYSEESPEQLAKEFRPIIRDWEYVPYHIKRRIWGEHYHMRTHHGESNEE
ncbi:hypothetical protein BG003_009579 [Podila horticola]|nr:hypothetical protein BG003_009579 [Podila horticola]